MEGVIKWIESAVNPSGNDSFARDESETDKEQEIKQKNVCSGWTVCTNIATGATP
jgi:hypothetical protein